MNNRISQSTANFNRLKNGLIIIPDNLAQKENEYILENCEEFIGVLPKPISRVTIVDIFSSRTEAKSAVLELERQGLRSHEMAIVAKNYQEFGNPMNWEDIAVAGGLIVVLIELGISEYEASEFVGAVEDGKFLVIAIVSDRQASQAQHILENIGRWVVAVH